MLFQFHQVIQLFWRVSLIVSLWFGWELSFAEKSLDVIGEYQVKATFLMRFGKFINYPEGSLGDSGAAFNICILGEEPFQGFLDTLVKNEKFQGRQFKVNYLQVVDNAGECQVLFISQSEQKQLSHILAYLKQRPILTVSDMADFVIRGGMIQFYILDNKVRFFIDPEPLKEAPLVPSARLLRLANIIFSRGTS